LWWSAWRNSGARTPRRVGNPVALVRVPGSDK